MAKENKQNEQTGDNAPPAAPKVAARDFIFQGQFFAKGAALPHKEVVAHEAFLAENATDPQN